MTKIGTLVQPANLAGMQWGMEIEGVVPSTVASPYPWAAAVIANTIHGERCYNTVTDGQGREYECKHDSSIRGNGRGVEITTPPLTYEDLPAWLSTVHALHQAGFRSSPEDRCGIHVHVDARQLDGRAILYVVNWMAGRERFLYESIDVSTGREEQYCRALSPALVASLNKAQPQTHTDILTAIDQYNCKASERGNLPYDRYSGVNLMALADHGTIEFRYFTATTNPIAIKAYVQFTLALVRKALVVTQTRQANAKEKPVVDTCAKFDMRVALLRLDMVRKEFSTTRKYLCNPLPGDNRHAVGRTTGEHAPSRFDHWV
jgi:Putative amidoligase enzyme